ncbi:hypothetical protein PS914_05042 [Pseudomonas fluorescens]|uniref:hypothetical protein n=1 Tax=Pseudomonas fluorescens TaxID=294 RepID=UPI001241ACE7|nr:hypothetical protein [Pseudomonas fluorescens]VVQ09890.1 hypothetical protein PS914_05042 [Pseudomonas fluorescens]
MTLFKVLESGAAARARTNMLKLPGDLEGILDRLSNTGEGVGHIHAAVVEVTRKPAEKSEEYFQRVDSTIKDFIRKELGLSVSTGVHYCKFSGRKGMFGFLYLSNQSPMSGQVRGVVAEHSLNLHYAIQALLDLRLKLSFLTDVEKHYDIAPVEFNADLYIGLVLSRVSRNGSHIFDALKYDLYFSKEQELVISLKRVTMHCSIAQDSVSLPVAETGLLMFDWAGKRFQRTRRLNATTDSDRNYMAFATNNVNAKACDLYHNSINYHQTDCLNRIERLLKHSGIAFSPVVYEATHQVKKFLEGLPTMSNPLWLLATAANSSSDEAWLGSIANLADKFGASRVLTADSLPAPSELQVGTTNYLVVSEKVKTPGGSKNGSSIFDTTSDESFNTFWQALAAKQRNPSADFDYYTEIKLHRFSKAVNSICQGFNVLPSKDPSTASIEKSLQEIALKESIFRDKAVTIKGAALPPLSLQLISCRRDWSENVFIQVLDVTVGGETIKIEDSRRFDETSRGEFNHEFKKLATVFGKEDKKPYDAIWDGAFLIRDKSSNAWLKAYNTARIPAIIGNTLFDNQERQDNGHSPSREVGIQAAALPYYLTPTRQNQRHSVFIQDNGVEGAWFFVASNKAANNTVPKQSLVYNAVITGECGTQIPVLSHPLGELFFSSLTFDIVKLRESAKTSILQKIVEVCLHN